ncbi:MAG: hypothetical protein Cons2KO_26180 [Congregibacter sp.]
MLDLVKPVATTLLALSLIVSSSVAVLAEEGSGVGCEKKFVGAQGYVKAVQLGDKLQRYLDRKAESKDTRVVLLGRAGSDSPEQRFQKRVSNYWNYTHAGFAYRDHPAGRWSVVHMLNDCGEESSIYVEGLVNFFLDNPHEYRVVVAIPSAQVQEALEAVVLDRDMAAALYNNSRYSSVSNPFNTKRQNSNEYLLDTTTAALALDGGVKNIYTREQSKAYLLSSGLQDQVVPERVKVKGIENLGMALGFGPMNATLDDHPRSDISKGYVNMVSVGTLIKFLENIDALESTTELALRDLLRVKSK